MREIALFAGAGGGVLGSHLAGWRTVCAVEISDFCRRVLRARIADGHLPEMELHDDVRTFQGGPWRGRVDIISGGFPCQDISSAGKGAGIAGERSGLWREFARIIGEAAPPLVLVENSPLLTGRGLDVVLRDLAALGYDASWGVFSAAAAGAPHRRERLWLLAYTDAQRLLALMERERSDSLARATGDQSRAGDQPSLSAAHCRTGTQDGAGWWASEPRLDRVAHGVADRVDRLAAIGNGQVPVLVGRVARVLAEQALGV